mgnify:CR=1 FL=1
MNRFADVFRPFLEGNVARELLEAPIHHIDAKREKRQITVELHPEKRIPPKEILKVEQQIKELEKDLIRAEAERDVFQKLYKEQLAIS